MHWDKAELWVGYISETGCVALLELLFPVLTAFHSSIPHLSDVATSMSRNRFKENICVAGAICSMEGSPHKSWLQKSNYGWLFQEVSHVHFAL